MLAVIIVVAVVVILALVLIVLSNGLVRSRNQVDNAWSHIDVQPKRRIDLVPNLVETVKGQAALRKYFEAEEQARSVPAVEF